MRQRFLKLVLNLVERLPVGSRRTAARAIMFRAAGQPHGIGLDDVHAIIRAARGIE